jgi:hypothetical protein
MIDPHRRSDVRKAIDAHLEKVPPGAAIRSIVATADIKFRLNQFDWADGTALKKQRSYRRSRLLALWATMTASVVGAFTLLPLDQWIAAWPRLVIQVLQAVGLALAFVATVWVGMRRSIGQWLQSRAVAERMRADVFRAIMRGGAASGETLAPVLACFRDAHLDWQLAFYNSRETQSAGTTAPYKMVGYVLLAVAVVPGLVGLADVAAKLQLQLPMETAIQSLRLEQPGRWQLGLGAMATSILAFARMRSFMDLDDRNASFYPIAAAELRRICSTDLAAAETAATRGSLVEVLAFCEAVQTAVDAEHLAWMVTRAPDNPMFGGKPMA